MKSPLQEYRGKKTSCKEKKFYFFKECGEGLAVRKRELSYGQRDATDLSRKWLPPQSAVACITQDSYCVLGMFRIICRSMSGRGAYYKNLYGGKR